MLKGYGLVTGCDVHSVPMSRIVCVTHMTIIIWYDGNTFQSNDTHQLYLNWVKELATSLLPSNTVKLWKHIYFFYSQHLRKGGGGGGEGGGRGERNVRFGIIWSTCLEDM